MINSLAGDGGDIDDGIEFLKLLAAWAKNLPGDVSGSYAARKTELLIREALTKAAASGGSEVSPARETSIRFFALMIKKNNISHLDAVIEETKRLLDKKRGIIPASVEYAFPVSEDIKSRIEAEIKKRSAAARVDLTEQLNTGLIGGFRLRIGDEIIDASVRSQLHKLEACLAGNGGY